MDKVKFASLVLLGVFSTGCVSSGVVSAQNDTKNLVNTVIENTDTRDDSAQLDIQVSNEKLDITNVDDGSDIGERTERDNVCEKDDKDGDYVFLK